MGNVVVLVPKQRVDRTALEANLRKVEKTMPFLRRHLKELADNPTKLHLDQVKASLDLVRQSLDYIQYTIKDLKV